jgi:hypothetical protein
MTTIMLYLTKSGWNQASGGWHCPALKIPGAKVESLRVAGTKQSDEWYTVDIPNETIRWNRPDPPDDAVLSLSLTKKLTTQERLVAWATFNPIVAAVIAAGASILVGFGTTSHVVPPGPAPAPTPVAECGSPLESKAEHKSTPCYATWRVSGRIDTLHAPKTYYAMFLPPRLAVDTDGVFTKQEFPVRFDGLRWQFPSITFFPDSKEYTPYVVHIDDPNRPAQHIDYRLHEIQLDQPVAFVKSQPAKKPNPG